MIDGRAHTGRLTLPRASAALAVTAAAVLAVALADTDSLVEHGFAAALDGARAGAPAKSAYAGISGSEDFWLRGSRLPGTAPASWSKPPAIEGERVTITAGGREIVLEVVDVSPLDAAAGIESTVTRIDTGEARNRLLVVTCREAGAADARPIRFLVEPNAALPWRSLGAPAHTL